MGTAEYMGSPQPAPGIAFRNFTMQILLIINEEKNQALLITCWNQFQWTSRSKKYRGATYGTCLSWLHMPYWGITKGLSGLNTACKGYWSFILCRYLCNQTLCRSFETMYAEGMQNLNHIYIQYWLIMLGLLLVKTVNRLNSDRRVCLQQISNAI